MNIRELQKEAHATSKEKGFYDPPPSVLERIALMHSELSEAAEEYRKGNSVKLVWWIDGKKPEGFPIELADCIIRICDAAEYFGIDLERAIKVKMEYNKTRSYKHGGKLA